MYYILVYDIACKKRLPKVLKVCRKFLYWIQKSVFEGELTQTNYNKLKAELKKVTNRNEDSVILFAIRNKEVFNKEILGIEKNEITNFF